MQIINLKIIYLSKKQLILVENMNKVTAQKSGIEWLNKTLSFSWKITLVNRKNPLRANNWGKASLSMKCVF